jgi:hypothetical protein
MIDILEIIESVEKAGEIKAKKVDLMEIIEAVERSGPGAPIPKAVLGKVIGDAVARPTCAVNREEEECAATKPVGSKQSWSAVGIYCWQMSEGPRLTTKRDLTKENLPEDWFEQHVRSISSSVLDRFHADSIRKFRSARSDADAGEPLPLLEAKRIVKILERRLGEPETATQEKAFLRTAIRRGMEYIEAWDQVRKINRKASE